MARRAMRDGNRRGKAQHHRARGWRAASDDSWVHLPIAPATPKLDPFKGLLSGSKYTRSASSGIVEQLEGSVGRIQATRMGPEQGKQG
ncbi:hypothetical protein AJ80_07877 [Polytolypa hystricis UAMH7299]|uniref:Uncharacterized protein n=1 Tax=Polytolypa hystricis (strain UAMH7299) TaxID=1447883 RepID=A0A2B7XHM7_POLH7|nr:hypothetical protein AJ80_07877 [Polytolypa hystricis UAMH7299]